MANNNEIDFLQDDTEIDDNKYYLNKCSNKTDLYITARLKNTGIERGHLQYKIKPDILKDMIINNIEDNNIIIEENTEEYLKRLLPKTTRNGDCSNWKLLLVVKYKDNNWIKGALLDKRTNLIALMTSANGKDKIIEGNHRAISSHDDEWFIGHYRLTAPLKFWYELIKILNIDNNTDNNDNNDIDFVQDDKHIWTKEETIIMCKMYKDKKTPKEIKEKLPKIKLSSIKMKYSNCLFLEKGNVKGSLNSISIMHKNIWSSLSELIADNQDKNEAKDTKDNIPKIKKQEIWEYYIGIDIGRTKCLCCNINDITQFNFVNGHIIAKSKGGDMSKENLCPICQSCNSSMGNENMIEFMNRLKYDTSRLKIKEEIEDEEEEKKIIIKCKMRNNQYAKHFNVFDTIRYTNKIVCPWGHWKDTNELFDEGKFRNEKFSNIFINYLKKDDIICMFDREYNYALLLEITSDPITEKIKEMIIVRNNKCNHKPIFSNCDECGKSIEKIFTDKYFEENYKEFTKYLNEDYFFENMYAIIRNIKIIGRIDEKCEFYNIGKKLQNSICRVTTEILKSYIFKDEDTLVN